MRVAAVGLGLAAALVAVALFLFVWSFFGAPGAGKTRRFEVLPSESSSSLIARLAGEQLRRARACSAPTCTCSIRRSSSRRAATSCATICPRASYCGDWHARRAVARRV